ncbi:hypothetical protein CEXT_535471 [Caerostris extrusa]|uniref:Uncharacterized protein n=1 Tax=Caerostris extrusa TaxID=172846 RepID=A0AAV4MYY7_CAEEX|nr:hypothetical protein CEXT_535471 [Caerostris extrusa]
MRQTTNGLTELRLIIPVGNPQSHQATLFATEDCTEMVYRSLKPLGEPGMWNDLRGAIGRCNSFVKEEK